LVDVENVLYTEIECHSGASSVPNYSLWCSCGSRSVKDVERVGREERFTFTFFLL
jgi:hypothetical protein